MAALDMDNYDREDETDDEEDGEGMDGEDGEVAAKGSRRVLDGLFGGDDALYYASNAEDPYMALARGAAARGGEEDADPATDAPPPTSDSEDEEAWDLRPSDFVLAAARTEDDVSTLEVWVYEAGARGGGEANLYVHHDLLLGAFPLALAWMDCAPGGAGGPERSNFVAVGTMDPVVELWDLDAADAVSPVATLGAGEAAPKDGKKKKKGAKAAARAAAKAGGPHAGAVLGLAWNATVRNVLASASADETVKVWDVSTAGGPSPSSSPVTTLTHHTDKVQALVWHPADPAVLLSGGFDGRACLADVRAPGSPEKTPAWGVGSDVEALAWDPAHPTRFCVASEDGHVTCFDARAGGGSSPLWTLGAHSRPTTGLAFAGAAAPGLLATGSTDKTVKLWDVSGGGSTAPVCVESADLRVGAVFAMGFAGDDALPGVLAVAGAKGTVAVWEVGASDQVAERWAALAA
jgi:periodic tryptophan protein 1